MKMIIFLLVSAVANPTHHKPDENLNRIIDLAAQYNKSLTQEFFVEDVSNLVDGGCEDRFFCKVHDILHKHKHFGARKQEKELVENLNVFIADSNKNCTELLERVTSTGSSTPIPKLLDHLTTCIQQRNLIGTKKSNA